MVKQLSKIPTRISWLSLILHSKAHKNVLFKVLNEGYVTPNLLTEKLNGLVVQIHATNYIAFTDKESFISRVLIDNGSALNVMPKSTMFKLGFELSNLMPSNVIVKAFDGTERQVLSTLKIAVEVAL